MGVVSGALFPLGESTKLCTLTPPVKTNRFLLLLAVLCIHIRQTNSYTTWCWNSYMEDEKKVIRKLKNWALSIDNIRALILTSSRADPLSSPDLLSDYDVEVFVNDTDYFIDNDDWLKDFGPIIVRWPSTPRPTFDKDWITQLVLFSNNVRIDFQITSLGPGKSQNLSSGYSVIVDKDNLTADLPLPTYPYRKIAKPTAEEFDSRMVAFWWDILYVAKGLCRQELNYAKYILDGTIRFEKLQPVLKWYIGIQNDWNVNTGWQGRWFHKYLDKEIWQLYEKTFADADLKNNWKAMYATIELFRTVSRKVASSLGFTYPEDTDRKVTEYIEMVEKLNIK